MFGNQDDQPSQGADDVALNEQPNETPATDETVSSQPADQPAEPTLDDTSEPAAAVSEPDQTAADQPAESSPPDNDTPAWQHPGTSLGEENGSESEHEPISDIISPAGGYPKRPSYQYATAGAGPSSSTDSSDISSEDHELLDIKHQALEELSPLVDQLDLPPEEKFHAIMMVLQDNDNQDLVKAAFETAHAIEDEKTRGLALLSIVNEINYFTSPHDAKPQAETNN